MAPFVLEQAHQLPEGSAAGDEQRRMDQRLPIHRPIVLARVEQQLLGQHDAGHLVRFRARREREATVAGVAHPPEVLLKALLAGEKDHEVARHHRVGGGELAQRRGALDDRRRARMHHPLGAADGGEQADLLLGGDRRLLRWSQEPREDLDRGDRGSQRQHEGANGQRHRRRQNVAKGEPERLRDDLGAEQDRDREREREDPERRRIEHVAVLGAGDRGPDRMGERVQDQDRRDRGFHRAPEAVEDRSGALSLPAQLLDAGMPHAEEHGFEDRADERNDERRRHGQDEESHSDSSTMRPRRNRLPGTKDMGPERGVLLDLRIPLRRM